MSKLFNLNGKDLIKGAIVTVLSSLSMGLLVYLDDSQIPTLEELKSVVVFSLVAGASYLLKNFITDDNDKIGGVV